ncbi:MAG: TonB-dependent receptor [Chitinophagaceae bacterium]|nr:TonB-dependent receptor [Chitinophagaceae bacterium]
MRTLTLLLISCLTCALVRAQQINGTSQDDQGRPLAGSSIALKKSKDSSVVKLGVSNASGKYEFKDIPAGNYFINISHVGYTPQNTATFAVSGEGTTNAPVISLIKAAADLKEVVITSRKPVVEVKADKIVLNVEGSVNAVGQDALELLRKSPGVTVDKDNNLSVSGKNGVQVFIDGRPTPLSGTDLAEYLKTIQSSSIESIEIISNPSAKYEAAGNAGIINIRLKKNKSFGTNGTVNAGYGVGIYSKYNAGFSLNHRDKNINVFGNYSYNDNPSQWHLSLYRKQLDTLFNQYSVTKSTTHTHNFKAGMDYFVSKKSTLGVIVSGTYADPGNQVSSSTPITYIPTGELYRTLNANNSSKGRRDNTNFNMNYRYADTSGHELNVDADYGLYRITNDQLQPNIYTYPKDPGRKDSNIYEMLSPSKIDIYSLKSDYEQNFAKGRLGLGFKASYVTTSNDFEQYTIRHLVKVKDTLHSNDFDYKENINAVYANYNRTLKGWVFQAGLRVENTNIKGTSTGYSSTGGGFVTYDSTFKRNYTNFFPSGAVTYNKNPMKQWTLSYSRRIDRPAYQDLNPFEFKLDEYTFQKGNTELRPQYTNSIGLTYMYKFKLTTTLNYSHVKDVFTMLVDTTELSKSFISKKNLATQDITSLNISYPFQYKWYSVFANVNTYYSLYKANFGKGRTVDANVFACNVYAQQTARFAKVWTGEISGFFTSPSLWQGTFKTKSIWSVDAGLSRTLLKGNATVKASVSDIFATLRWTSTSEFAGQYVRASGGFESRQFKLNFTYRFGNTQVKAARQRKTGDEDESKRVGTQGGGLSQ